MAASGRTGISTGDAAAEPLAAHPLARSTSAAVVRDSVNSLTAEQHLLVPHHGTALDATVNGLHVGAVSLVFVAYGAGVTIVSPPSGRRAVIVIPQGPMLVQSAGNSWVAHAPFALSSDHQTKMVPDPGLGAVVGAVDADVLERHLAASSQRLLVKPVSLSGSAPLQLVRASMVRHAWLETCRELDRETVPQDPTWSENVLLSTMSAGLAPFLEPSFASSPEHGLPAYVDSACRYFDRNLSGKISMDLVASAVGISTRQLHAAFRHHLGRTPAQVLRDMRLARARRQLEMMAPSASMSVAAVAHDAGFSHLGRFSAYYTQKYRESPSGTVQRVRAEAKALRQR